MLILLSRKKVIKPFRKRRKRADSGMTILELMTALAIIAIMAAIGIPTFLTIKDKSIIGATEGNLNIMRKALNNYMVDSPVNRYPIGPLEYAILRSNIPFANMPADELEAKIETGSLLYLSDGMTYTMTARSSNRFNQLFTVTPAGLVRN